MSDLLDRNLGLEPVRVTGAAVPAAGHWMDKSAKEAVTSDDRSEERQCFLYRKRQYNGELFRGVQYSGHGARP